MKNLSKLIQEQTKIVEKEQKAVNEAKKTGREFAKRNIQTTATITPIEAALEKFTNSFANTSKAINFTSVEEAASQFLEQNKNFDKGLKMSQVGLSSLNDELAALTFNSNAEKLKFVNVQLSKLQSDIAFEKFKTGAATLAETRSQILQTIDVLRAAGDKGAVEKQLAIFKKLEDARIKEAKSMEGGLSRQQFITDLTDSVIGLNKETVKLGAGFKFTEEAEKKLIEIRDKVIKGDLELAEANEKVQNVLKETGLSFDELRYSLGLIKADELRNRFVEGFKQLYGKSGAAYKAGEDTVKAALVGITDAGKTITPKNEAELSEGLAFNIFDEITRVSNEARAAQENSMREYALSSGDYVGAQQNLIQAEQERRDILEDLINKEISASDAMIRLRNSLSNISRLNLKADFDKGIISADEYRQGIQQLNDGLRQGTAGVKGDFGTIKEEIGNLFLLDRDYQFNQTKEGLKDVFSTLRDGTKGALKEVIMGTSSMKEAFQKVFASIGEKMLDRTIGMFVDSLFYLGTGFLRRNQGGVVGYNGGGVVQGGSGVRDDVPALLTKGEYVVRKSAVNKYGSGFLEKINSGKIRKYRDGGSASFNLMNQFDYNDPNRPTAGTMNVDSRMSAFAQTDQNNPMNQLKFEKEQTLDSYLKEKAAYEEQKRQAMAAYKKQRKGIIKQAFISIALAGVQTQLAKYIDKKMVDAASKPVGDLGTSLGKGDNIKKVSAAAHNVSPQEATAVMREYRAMVANNPKLARRMEIYAKRGGAFSLSPATGGGLGTLRSGRPAGGVGFGNPYRIDYEGKSKGGVMGPRGGGSDNIPALLTGGEYVVNKRSVDHYGLKFMEDLNKGRLPGFNRGGLVGEGGNGTPTATGTGGAPSNVNNNITINVTVEKDGNVSTDTTNEQAGGNQNTQGALQEEERNKQFSGAIKDAVVREIVEQKRPGGLLYNEQRTSA